MNKYMASVVLKLYLQPEHCDKDYQLEYRADRTEERKDNEWERNASVSAKCM